MLALRRPLGLATLITERHIEVLAKLLLVSSLCMGYAYMHGRVRTVLQRRRRGAHAVPEPA